MKSNYAKTPKVRNDHAQNEDVCCTGDDEAGLHEVLGDSPTRT